MKLYKQQINMERCSIEHSTRKKQTEAILGYYYTPVTIAKSRAGHLQMLARFWIDRNLEGVSPRNDRKAMPMLNQQYGCLKNTKTMTTNRHTKVEGRNLRGHHPRQRTYRQLMIAEKEGITLLQGTDQSWNHKQYMESVGSSHIVMCVYLYCQ